MTTVFFFVGLYGTILWLQRFCISLMNKEDYPIVHVLMAISLALIWSVFYYLSN